MPGQDAYLKALTKSLSGGALAAIGVHGVELAAPLPTELPANVLHTDKTWRMQDNRVFHLEFQHDRETDLHRFLEYDVRLARHHRMKIRTVVLYHGEVTRAPEKLDIGTAKYRVENVYLSDQSGDAALDIVARHLRTDGWEPEDRLRLALSMNMDLVDRKQAFERVFALVPQVSANERDLVVAALLALGEKGLSEAEQKRLREELRQVSKMAQDLYEEGKEEGREEGREEGEAKKAAAVARAMLAEGMDTERIARLTGLSAEEVELLRKQVH